MVLRSVEFFHLIPACIVHDWRCARVHYGRPPSSWHWLHGVMTAISSAEAGHFITEGRGQYAVSWSGSLYHRVSGSISCSQLKRVTLSPSVGVNIMQSAKAGHFITVCRGQYHAASWSGSLYHRVSGSRSVSWSGSLYHRVSGSISCSQLKQVTLSPCVGVNIVQSAEAGPCITVCRGQYRAVSWSGSLYHRVPGSISCSQLKLVTLSPCTGVNIVQSAEAGRFITLCRGQNRAVHWLC